MATRQRYDHRKRHKPGTSPGTLTAAGNALQPIMTLIGYGPGQFTEVTLKSPDEIQNYVGMFPVIWINIDGLGSAEIIQRVGDMFQLHPLALEDTMNVHQRPKTDDYITNIYTVCRMANDSGPELDLEQISIFFGKGFVISFQEAPGDCWNPVRDRIRKGPNTRLLNNGADYLAYALLDALIDGYFPLLERFGDRLDALEEDVFSNPDSDVLVGIQKTKKALHALRHAIWPLRESIGQISNHEELVEPGTKIFLRDCQDHVIQILDILENDRERVSSLMDIYLSSLSQRMNQVIRVLTVISTIFMPLTFIVGIYGMNFNPSSSRWSMPELNHPLGYPTVMVLMFVLALAMVVVFWRAGWFGVDGSKSKNIEKT